MGVVRKFSNGVLDIKCDVCNGTFSTEVPSKFSPKFLEEFGQYENLPINCKHCEPTGKPTTIFINLNIPEGELDEEDVEYMMPLEEINARKYIRDIMWTVRPDLKTKDRAIFNKERVRVSRPEIEAVKSQFGDFGVTKQQV